MGSKYKVFQEILKTYGDVKINTSGVSVTIKELDEESSIELFHRLIFSKLSNPGINEFSWDVIKKVTRSEMEKVTLQVNEDLKEFLENENLKQQNESE